MSFKEDIKVTMANMRPLKELSSKEIDDDNLCFRGLENVISPEGAMLRMERRQKALDVVIWDEFDNGISSPECVAAAYRAISRRSQIDAHLQALKYSEEENPADNARSGEWEGPISSIFGKMTKSAFRSVGGTMRNLGIKLVMKNQIIPNVA
jgi:hypothetical protein